MRHDPKRLISHRRRREQRTNYRSRLALVKSGKPRVVIRKSTNDLVCQIVHYEHKGDKSIVSASIRELKKLGWQGGPGNIPSAYLTGLLCGTKAKKANIPTAILDIGVQKSTKGSRLYAALKGCLDAGIEIPHSKDVLPSEDITTGKHIGSYATKLKKENTDLYQKTFSQILKTGALPEEIQSQVFALKEKILKT